MRKLPATALCLSLLAVAGCSALGIESKRVDYKSAKASSTVSPLEVPPDLTAPATQDQYTIPESGGETVATYSGYSREGAGQVRQQPSVSTVLPESRSVRLERSGAQRWLVVNDRAENVWPQVVAFWKENGFNIKQENPQAGVIETDWAENRAYIPEGGVRGVVGKVFSGMYDSGRRDMYRTRLERSKDGSSTEIYVSQYGKEEVLDADKNTSKWQSIPTDPELEATMLQMLMAKLGGGAQTEAKAPAAAGEVAAAAPVRMQELSGGNKVIVVNEPFDKCWRRVGLALERMKATVEDKDRANGAYYVRPGKAAEGEKSWVDSLMFWRDDEGKDQRYRVTVKEGSTGCEVAAENQDGASDEASQRLIETVYQQINK